MIIRNCSTFRSYRTAAARKLLEYISDTTINGFNDYPAPVIRKKLNLNPWKCRVSKTDPILTARNRNSMPWDRKNSPSGSKISIKVFFTDTTMRDAHQSLFATRVRTIDILRVLESASKKLPNLFSYECWGGATFKRSLPFHSMKILGSACVRCVKRLRISFFRCSSAVPMPSAIRAIRTMSSKTLSTSRPRTASTSSAFLTA